jgi:hypothetical protein
MRPNKAGSAEISEENLNDFLLANKVSPRRIQGASITIAVDELKKLLQSAYLEGKNSDTMHIMYKKKEK